MRDGEYKVNDVDRIFITTAVPSVSGVGGDAGLMSAQDKEKLDGLSPSTPPTQIAMAPQPQSGSSITVDCQIRNADGPIAISEEVVIESLAGATLQGAITTVTGTEQMNTGAPSGQLSSAVIVSLPDGTFSFSISDSQITDFVLVRATCDAGLVGQVNLAFHGLCFAAGTRVAMADGTRKSIEDVVVDDVVVSFDEKTGLLGEARVSKVFAHKHAGSLVVVNGVLRATPNHPVYAGGKYVEAGKLRGGEVLLSLALNGALVEKSARPVEEVAGATMVYNLEVETYHNYFADGLLVHNK